jgi:O-antigen/teichoic acid export membrane protein
MKIFNLVKSRWYQLRQISPFGSLVAFTILTNLFLAILALLTGILAARLLGPTGRGELAAIQTWPTFFATIAMLGVPEALVYFTARRSDRAATLLVTSTLIGLIACLPVAIIGYLLIPILLKSQTYVVVTSAQNYLWSLPLFALVGMLPQSLRGRNDLVPWNLVRTFPALMWLLVLLLGAFTSNISPTVYTKWYLVGLALLFFPMSIIVRRRIIGAYRPTITDVRPLLGYGLPAMLSSLPSTLNLKLDQMLMVGLFTPELLGLYVVAVAWSSAALPILSALPATMVPRVAGSLNKPEQIQYLTQLTRLGSLLSVIISIFFVIITPIILPLLFGSEYINAIPAAMILSVGAAFISINQLFESGLMGLGKPKLVLLAQILGLLFTITLLSLLLPRYKIIGAAVASVISYGLITVIYLIMLYKESGIGWKYLIIPNSGDGQLILSKLRSLTLLLHRVD